MSSSVLSDCKVAINKQGLNTGLRMQHCHIATCVSPSTDNHLIGNRLLDPKVVRCNVILHATLNSTNRVMVAGIISDYSNAENDKEKIIRTCHNLVTAFVTVQ